MLGSVDIFFVLLQIFFLVKQEEKLPTESKNWGEGAGSLRGGGLK